MSLELAKFGQLAASLLKSLIDSQKKADAVQREKLDNAAKLVALATIKTRAYMASRASAGGQRDRDREAQLAEDWTVVQHSLVGMQNAHAARLVRVAAQKALYWADPEWWESRGRADMDISLNQVVALSILAFKQHHRP